MTELFVGTHKTAQKLELEVKAATGFVQGQYGKAAAANSKIAKHEKELEFMTDLFVNSHKSSQKLEQEVKAATNFV